jgi:hypothetical protein
MATKIQAHTTAQKLRAIVIFSTEGLMNMLA